MLLAEVKNFTDTQVKYIESSKSSEVDDNYTKFEAIISNAFNEKESITIMQSVRDQLYPVIKSAMKYKLKNGWIPSYIEWLQLYEKLSIKN